MDSNALNTLYTEVGRFTGSIQQLLVAIDKKVDDLPDNRDISDIVNKLNRLLEKSNLVYKELSTHIDDFDTNIELIKELRTILIESKKVYSEIQLILCDKNSELLKQIKNISNLADMINEQINRSNILLGKDNEIQLHDFGEVIALAKRANKRYEMWKGWKGKVAFIMGALLGSSFIINSMKGFLELLLEFFK